MKTGKKSFIGRRSFNSVCYEIVWGIMCSLSAPQQAAMHLQTCNFESPPISESHLFYFNHVKINVNQCQCDCLSVVQSPPIHIPSACFDVIDIT